MSGYRNPIDTSHYAECTGYLNKFRRNHTRRLILTIILLIFNFYFRTAFFATNYAGPSIREAMYNNEGMSLNLTHGILILLYMMLAFAIGFLMYKKEVRAKYLFLYAGANVLIMTIFTISSNLKNAGVQREGAAPHQLPFAYGILTIFLSIACIALAFFGEQKHPKVHIALIIVTFLAALSSCYHWVIAGILLLMYVIAIPEFKKMQWIMQQQGYPYFSEEFEEAKLHSEYEPMHRLDNRSYGEMEDIDGNTITADEIKAKEDAHREEAIRANTPTMDYTMKLSDDPAEMPGIDDIFEHVEPMPEPDPPKAADIPDTKWDVPDVKADIPDTKWDVPDVKADIPDTKWDVPDVNTDIPDLPEIPDIPTL